MATKGERERSAQQRAAQAKHPKRKAHDSAGKRAAARGRRKDRLPNPESHNETNRGERTSPYLFEPSATGRPSRKSTRRSGTRAKPDATLRIRAMNRVASPRQRATRRSGNPNG
jgi:hypothetical protein